MTPNPIEIAMRRVLNDRRILWMPYELMNKAKWFDFRQALCRNDRREAASILESAEGILMSRISDEKDNRRKKDLEEAKTLLISLKVHINESPTLVRNLADKLDTFGPLKTNLPNMEDFGRVIEGHGRPIAEQFFLYKIQKEQKNHRRKALAALLEVVKELYEQRVSQLEIAFFVRKLESLTQIVEVMKWKPSKP